MSALKIKKENAPTRCEVCHQSDMFNSQTQYCSRCSGVVVSEEMQLEAQLYVYQPVVNPQEEIFGKVAKHIILGGMGLGGFIGLLMFLAATHVGGVLVIETVLMIFLGAMIGAFVAIPIGLLMTIIVKIMNFIYKMVFKT